MTKRSPILTFESQAFQKIPGEDSDTNPGISGQSLARWLEKDLRKAGIATDDLIAEDFGWCVPVKAGPYKLYVACAAGEMADQWTAFVFVEGAWIERLIGRDNSAHLLDSVYASVKHCLETEPNIHGLREIPS